MANATAVSFRKGTRDEHRTWTGGVNGEITVDTTDYTLWVHNGNSASVGNPLAKADTSNINTADLADATIHNSVDGNKPLTYNDLTNVQITDVNTAKNNLRVLGYANSNLDNINTSTLASGRSGLDGDLNLAYANMSNAMTSGLAERTAEQEADKGKNLAYKDMSNVSTDEFTAVDGSAQGDRVAKADLSNVDNTILTNKIESLNKYADKKLSNLDNDISSSLDGLHTRGIQTTTLLNTSSQGLDNSDTKYPSSKLVKDTIDALDKLPTQATSGKTSYQVLTESFPYQYTLTITNAGTGYAEHDMLDVVYEAYTAASTMPTASAENVNQLYQYTGTTTATYTQGSFYKCTFDGTSYSWVETSPKSIKIRVIEVDTSANNSIDRFEILTPKYGTIQLTEPNCIAVNIHTGTNATFELTSVITGETKLQWKEPASIPLIQDIEVTEKDVDTNQTVGRVTVTISEIPRTIEIKTLIKGETIPGDTTISPDGWTPLDKEMTFTPLDPADVLTSAWVIKVS